MPGVGADAFDGADIDDAAAAPRAHQRQQRLGQEDRGAHVDRHHPVPVVLGHLVQRLLEHEAGIVDQDIGAAEAPLDLPRDDVGRFAIRQVGFDPGHLRVGAQLFIQRLALGDQDPRTRLQQFSANPAADAASAAGHDGHLVVQHHSFLSRKPAWRQ
ncbi:hypothetical protein D3C76_1314100 [compost metagenome]